MFYRKTIDKKYTLNSLFYSSSHAKLAQFKIIQGWNQVSPENLEKYAIAERFSECFISDRSPKYPKLSGITGTLYGTTHYLVW